MKQPTNNSFTVNPKSLKTKSIDKPRSTTDSKFIILLGTTVIVWISLSIYEFIYNRSNYSLNFFTYPLTTNPPNKIQVWIYIVNDIFERVQEAIFYDSNSKGLTEVCLTVISGMLMLNFIFILRCIPKVFIYIEIIILNLYICLHITSMVCNFYQLVSHNMIILGIATFITNTLIAIFIATALFCTIKVGINALATIIKQSCKAMLFFPSYILFFSLIFILNTLLTVYTITIFRLFKLQSFTSIILLFTTIYIDCFINYFTIIVVSKIAVTWFRTDRKEIQNGCIFRSAAITARFHLGTVAFGATIILPFFVSVYAAWKLRTEKYENLFLRIIWKIYLIFKVTEYTLILTGMHGYNFVEGTKKAFQLTGKKCSLSLAFTITFSIILLIGLIIAMILPILLYIYLFPELGDLVTLIVIIVLVFTLLLQSFVLIAIPSGECILLCTLEDEVDNQVVNTIITDLNSVNHTKY